MSWWPCWTFVTCIILTHYMCPYWLSQPLTPPTTTLAIVYYATATWDKLISCPAALLYIDCKMEIYNFRTKNRVQHVTLLNGLLWVVIKIAKQPCYFSKVWLLCHLLSTPFLSVQLTPPARTPIVYRTRRDRPMCYNVKAIYTVHVTY